MNVSSYMNKTNLAHQKRALTLDHFELLQGSMHETRKEKAADHLIGKVNSSIN